MSGTANTNDWQNTFQYLESMPGLRDRETRYTLGRWLSETAYVTERSFTYSQSFPPTEPACAPPPFARSFAHRDWTDGESVVQAGATPGGDEGFNARFHKIEDDLDRLGTLTAQAFTCLNSMRASLSRALDEIRSELNRVNADLARLQREANEPQLRPGGYIGPKRPIFRGRTQVSNQQFQMWEMPDGEIMELPVPRVQKFSVVDPLPDRAPGIVEIVAEVPAIRLAAGQGVKVKKLIEAFGDSMTGDGRTLAELLAPLPEEETFSSIDAVVERMTEMDLALVKGMGGEKKLREQFGQPVGELGAASVTGLPEVSPNLATALAKEGVRTLKDLAELDGTKLATIASSGGLTLGAGKASALVGRARTLIRL